MLENGETIHIRTVISINLLFLWSVSIVEIC